VHAADLNLHTINIQLADGEGAANDAWVWQQLLHLQDSTQRQHAWPMDGGDGSFWRRHIKTAASTDKLHAGNRPVGSCAQVACRKCHF
jgi:hypothetical protein